MRKARQGGRGTHRGMVARGLRRRLVVTLAMVAAVASVSVAATSYYLVRRATLHRATAAAVREGLADLEEAAVGLPDAATLADVEVFHAGLELRDGVEVVTLVGDGSVATSSSSVSAGSVPAVMHGPVASGRVVSVRTTVGDSPYVVVGGRVLPDGPSSFFFFPLAEELADLALVRNVLAGVSGALVILSAGLGAVAARGFLRPIRRTRDAVRSLEKGLLGTRLPEGGRDELAELARSFNRMAERLQSTVGELRALESSHRRFVADVSHELRTPLTALTTAADVLEVNVDGINQQGRRAARLLVVETRRLSALVEDLMEISRLDAGAAVMSWALLDIRDATNAALNMRGWEGEIETLLPAGVTVWADPRRFDAIVSNLVRNGLEHGGPPVAISASADADHVEVEVSDAGDGIAPEHLPHVFDRFYKANPARSRSDGSGLGLAIARENARLHGGDLIVASRPGGTTFTLVLPRRQPPDHEGDTATSVAQSLHP